MAMVRWRVVLVASTVGLAGLAPLGSSGVAEPEETAKKTISRSTRSRAARARRTPPRRATPSLPTIIVSGTASEWDLKVAAAAQRALGRTRGGVVALDPRSGRVIAVVNPDQAVQQAYQPCSVFKIVVAVAGLTEGVITPETTYRCEKGCSFWPGHGTIDLRRALAVSCNPFFEHIGEQLGYEKVEHYARLLGLGELSGINLTGESPGTLPVSVPESRVGHLSSHAAGIRTTALQLAVLLSATINGGVVYKPQIAAAEGYAPLERWRLSDSIVLDGVFDGCISAVNEGTARSAFARDLVVGGKTGTCSSMGWFASFAPAENPELALVVVMRPGSGHRATQIAGEIYQALYGPAALPETAVGG